MKDKDKIAYLFEEAVNNFNAGDYPSAIGAWKEILKFDPGNQQAELGIRVAEERLSSETPGAGVQVTEGMDVELPDEGAGVTGGPPPGYPSGLPAEPGPQPREPGYSPDLSGWGLPGGAASGEPSGYGQPSGPQQMEYGAGGYGAGAPGYDAPSPGYGAEAPGYGEQPPGYGAEPPGYGAQPPGSGAQPPGTGPAEAPSGDQVLEDIDLPAMDLPDLESGFRPGAGAALPPPAAPPFPAASQDSADQTLISSGAPLLPPPTAPEGGMDDLGPIEDLDLPVAMPTARPASKPAASPREEPFGGGQREFELSGDSIPLAAPRQDSGRVSADAVDEVEDLEDLGEGAPVPPPPPPAPRAPRPQPDPGLDSEAIPTVPLREPRPAARPATMYRPAGGGLDVGMILKIAIPVVAIAVLAAGGYFGFQAAKKRLGGRGDTTPVESGPTGPVRLDRVVLLADCESATDSEDWAEAVATCCDRFLKSYPKDERAKRLCAEAREAKERPPEFNKRFEEARDRFCRDESWESALYLLRDLQQTHPRYAAKIEPWIVDGYVNWGIEKLQIRQPREAVEFGFKAAQERAPADEGVKELRRFAEAWMDRRTSYDYDRQVQRLTFRKNLCK